MEEAGWPEQEAALLRRLFLFQGLDPAELQAVLSRGDCYYGSYRRGQVIYSPTDFQRALGVLLEGAVTVTKEGEPGHPMIVSVLKRGEAFGAAALFHDGEDYVTTLTAREDCRILFFPQQTVALFLRNPRMAENYVRYLSGRIHFLNSKIDSLIAGTGQRKLAQYLLSALDPSGGQPRVELPCSLSGLADRLHIGRASLYRAFDQLQRDGIARRSGRTVLILDLERLQLV